MKKMRWWFGGLGLAGLAVAAYVLLWGKLFPFSPVAIGFARHECLHTIVYVQEGADFDDFERIDSLIPGVETFHDLHFRHKPHVYIFRDSANYARRSFSNARFCAFYNGSIVIAPWALREDREGVISLPVYLTHELSHSLLFENKGLWTAWRLPAWFLEGVATYSANQFGTSWYPSREETYDLIRQGNFMHPEDYGSAREDSVQLNVPYRMTFIYSEFGCIIDYLVERYDRDRFLQYLKGMCDDGDHNRVFQSVFDQSFDSFIGQFRQHVASDLR